jgi:hypothetical protein
LSDQSYYSAHVVSKITAETNAHGIWGLNLELDDGTICKAGKYKYVSKVEQEYIPTDDLMTIEAVFDRNDRFVAQLIFTHRDGSTHTLGPSKEEVTRRELVTLDENEVLIGAEMDTSAQFMMGITFITLKKI